jgi:hypothetical protein
MLCLKANATCGETFLLKVSITLCRWRVCLATTKKSRKPQPGYEMLT